MFSLASAALLAVYVGHFILYSAAYETAEHTALTGISRSGTMFMVSTEHFYNALSASGTPEEEAQVRADWTRTIGGCR